MAVNTWNGSTSTDFATAANWTTTGETDRVPTAADDVIIPDTSSINKCVLDQARNINSFVLAPDGELDQGNAFYIKGKNAAGEAVKCQGKLGDVSDFVVETQSAATVTLTKQSGSGSFRNLTITHASGDITLGAAASLSGNLTVTAGILNTSNFDLDCVLCHGNGTVKTGSGTYTATNDWRPDNTQLQVDGGTFTGIDQLGGAFDCNSKQVTIGCKRFHSSIAMTNGTSLVSDNSAEDVIVTATAAESNASVYGPLQGRINLVTNSSGSKDFVLKEDLTVNGRIVVSGSGEFRTYDGSNTYDLLVDGATFHSSNGGSAYSCLDMTNSAKFLSGSSNVILDAALGSNLCDVGTFDSGTTGWTAYTDTTITNDSGAVKIVKDDASSDNKGGYFYLNASTMSISELTLGKVYKVTFDAKVSTGSCNVKWTTQTSSLPFGIGNETPAAAAGNNTRAEALTATSYEKRVAYFVAGYTTNAYLYMTSMSTGQILHIDNITCQEVMANGSGGSAGHKMSYGLDVSSTSTACDLGTGFYYSCGTRWAGQNHTKTSGRFCAGSGDSTEYFSGGGNSLSLGTTDIIFLTNAGATTSIGWNISTTTWDCRGFYFYCSSASHWHAYWNHDSAPTINSPTSSTATKIHTYDCDMFILKGKFRTQYPSADKYSVGIVCTGDVKIFDDAELETHQDAYTSGTSCDHSFGTITVNSGGTYKATSKTTTITGPYIDDHFLYQNAGTFTHNNGTVKLSYTSYANVTSGGDAFYNLISDVNHGAYVGIQIMDALEVMNNLTINENDGFTCANGAVTVHGDVFCNGNWSRYNTSSQTQTIEGTLTIGSSGWYRPSSGTNNLGGIRNLGGSVN